MNTLQQTQHYYTNSVFLHLTVSNYLILTFNAQSTVAIWVKQNSSNHKWRPKPLFLIFTVYAGQGMGEMELNESGLHKLERLYSWQ